MKPLQILLASNSPRRRQLLSLTGWNFTIHPADVDESSLPEEAPDDYVLRLAESKARAARQVAQPDWVIVASDTAVVDGKTILGKPTSPEDARHMLRQLRGRTHQVYTAVAVFQAAEGTLLKDVCITDVYMRDYSDAELETYVESGDPLDKAGSYAIQNKAFHPVERISGCYASVMGLPICLLVRLLRQVGYIAPSDVAEGCQNVLEYRCPIYQAILSGHLD